MIPEKGITRSLEEYKKMKQDTAGYYIDWLAMNQLGEQLLALKRYEDARTLFEHNAAEFPDRDLVLLNLAKLYEETGRKEEAIIWYKKVIAVNPNYLEAKNRLKELQ